MIKAILVILEQFVLAAIAERAHACHSLGHIGAEEASHMARVMLPYYPWRVTPAKRPAVRYAIAELGMEFRVVHLEGARIAPLEMN
jgi:hypothetical protein